MKTACKQGTCQKLFDPNERCDYHATGINVCRYMNQTNGKCMHRQASERRTNKDMRRTEHWSIQNDMMFGQNKEKREKAKKPVVLMRPESFR